MFTLDRREALGPKKIKAELKLKGISDSLLEQVFSESSVDWGEVLESVIKRKQAKTDLP